MMSGSEPAHYNQHANEDTNMLNDTLSTEITNAFRMLDNMNLTQAQDIFSRVYSKTGEPSALYGLAKCAYQRKDFISALNKLHELINLDPDNADAHFLCGIISREMGDLKSAKSFLILAIQKNNNEVEFQRQYADVLLDLEEYENGVQAYVKILENHPDDVPALLSMGQLYLEVDQYESALLYAGKAMEHEPANPEILELINQIGARLEISASPAG